MAMVSLRNLRISVVVLLIALLATPAMAQASAVPEPNNLVLLGMGVAGVLIGRRVARRNPKD